MFRTRRLTTALHVPRPLDEVFPFFADAGNLQRITPPWLDFEIVTPRPIPMHAGALIDYRLRLGGLPMRWRTIIEVWDPPTGFVDLQLRGPYLLWRHTHTFEAVEGGTVCRDQVDYRVLGGYPVERLFVRPQLTRIFTHRQHATLAAFGAPPDPSIRVSFQ
ncbi:MAG: SRPBCC family protein [Vicinamibacterales bacterium]